MKKTIGILVLLLIASLVYSQGTLAKIKYEEAEEAYNNSDFKTALTRLDEVQKLLGSTNPKIMYLRIMAGKGQVEKGEYSYGLLDSLRKNIDFYIKNYESNTAAEDKYREVYQVSKQLTKYPANRAEYDKIEADKLAVIAKKKAEEQAALELFNAKAAKANRMIDSLMNVYRFKPGLTIAAFKNYNKEAAEKLTEWYNGYLGKRRVKSSNDGPYSMQTSSYTYSDTLEVTEYTVIVSSNGSKKPNMENFKKWRALVKENVDTAFLEYPAYWEYYPNINIKPSKNIPVGLFIDQSNSDYWGVNSFISLKFTTFRAPKKQEL